MKALQRHQLLDATWRTGPGAQYVIKRLGPVACSAIPAHIRRCPGDGSFEDGEWHWREGCDDCLRRAATGHLGWITPPPIIVFECERRIGPGDLPSASPS
jgi:hypothetical protein